MALIHEGSIVRGGMPLNTSCKESQEGTILLHSGLVCGLPGWYLVGSPWEQDARLGEPLA